MNSEPENKQQASQSKDEPIESFDFLEDDLNDLEWKHNFWEK